MKNINKLNLSLKLLNFDNLFKIVKLLIYYLFTSGIIVALSLVLLDFISIKYDLVKFFAFATAGFFIINLMQYNVVNKNNPSANLSFIIHTLYGVSLWAILAVSMYFFYILKFNIVQMNIAIISIMFLGFILYLLLYSKNYLY